jgi:hypothetical protein
MKYTAGFILMLSIGACTQAQKVPEYETINLTILKIERVREEAEHAQWLAVKLTMRDSHGIIYRASSRCVRSSDTPDSDMERVGSCQHLAIPRIARTYDARLSAGGTLIYFGEPSQGAISFEIDTEEVSGRLEGK